MKYTVETLQGCKIVRGGIPFDDFAALARAQPPEAVMDAHAARLLEATFVLGEPRNIATLITSPEVRERAQARVEARWPDLSPAARTWLAFGQQGQSSQTLFAHLTGAQGVADRSSHPHDASDFARCELLLEQVPELRHQLGKMAGVSPQWAALVNAWTDLVTLMQDEAPAWRNGVGSCRRASTKIREILAATTASPG